MVMSDREEYEERYGEHIGYCSVHHITVLGSCEYCDDEDRQRQQCTQCCLTDAQDDYVWTNVDGKMQLLCWDCTDKLRKADLDNSDRISKILNVDYLH